MTASAVVAASVSAVAVVGTNAGAAPSADEATYVAIPPCRLVDTRPDLQVGDRSTPIGPGETHQQQVTGSVGDCTIPEGATAVSLNVTVVNPTSPSFLTVFPFGGTRPNASNLNYVAGSPPVPNKVDVKLSDAGELGFYNLAGTVDLVADVGGYYTSNGLQDLVDDVSTKADIDDVFTKAETYSRSQIDDAMDALDTALSTDIGGKVDLGDVYTTIETYTRTEVDDAIGTVQDAVDTLDTELDGKVDTTDFTDAIDAINTDLATKASTTDLTDAIDTVNTALAGKVDTADLTAAVDTINTELATKASTTDLTDAIDAVNAALAGKVDAADVYDKQEQEDYFLGRDPDVVMRQATSEFRGLLGLLPFSLLGVTIGAGDDGVTELVGPAALDDAIHGRIDYRLNAVDFCIDGLVAGAIVDTVTVTVRDDAGVLTTIEDLTDRDASGCYTVDASAALDGAAYFVELSVVGDILTPLIGSVTVTSLDATFVPVTPPPAPPAP